MCTLGSVEEGNMHPLLALPAGAATDKMAVNATTRQCLLELSLASLEGRTVLGVVLVLDVRL